VNLSISPDFKGIMTLKSKESYNRRLRMRVIEILGGKCNYCGFDDARALQIDHIKGSGVKELKSMSRRTFHNKVFTLVRYINPKQKEYQLLCANCNWIKRSIDRKLKSFKGETDATA
jgi:predicted HNH restriction endonuclease